MYPVAGSVFGPAISLLAFLSRLSCDQLLDGLALLFGLADTRSRCLLSSLGLLKRALPVLICLRRGLGKGRGQSLPVAFVLQAEGSHRRSARRAKFRRASQPLAPFFRGGIQALLLVLCPLTCGEGCAKGLFSLLFRVASQIEQSA